MSSVATAIAGPDGAAIVAITVNGKVKLDGVLVGTSGKKTLVLAQFGL
ncbi:hypothetical protein [Nannocystis bainbridge]|uniref:Uncharacterized protein n=1 Tax=Nannocystis bainbridge TaxID=2995303 RepID=A0ABT5E9G4_9BACT|nr:hypothetical protein [Nannocystis bainbridge]MDC0722501.1 hypothetical protein [Nannocystis bainbridge]